MGREGRVTVAYLSRRRSLSLRERETSSSSRMLVMFLMGVRASLRVKEYSWRVPWMVMELVREYSTFSLRVSATI